jgi:hypothetical protein
MFLDDKLPPNAILIEYVLDVQQIDLSNFSLRYLRELRHILDEIHDAGVLHGDPYPRNDLRGPVQGPVDGFRFCTHVLPESFDKTGKLVQRRK